MLSDVKKIFSSWYGQKLLQLFKFLITVVLIIYVIGLLDFSKILDSLRQTQPFWICSAFVLMFLPRYVAAVQLKLLTNIQDMDFSTWGILRINLATSFYQLFLPGYLSGGFVRWYKLSRPERKNKEALAVIIFNRILDTAIMAWQGLLCWNLYLISQATSTGKFVGFLNVMIVFTAIVVYHFRQTLLDHLEYVSNQLNDKKAGGLRCHWNQFMSVAFRFKQLRLHELAKLSGLIFAVHALSSLVWYMLALGVNLNVGLFDIVWIRTAVILIVLLPVSISGLGVRELSLVFLLQPFGASANDAIVFSLFLFGIKIFFGIVGGILEILAVLKGRSLPQSENIHR